MEPENAIPGRGGPRQTLSYLRTLFEERGIKPKNKLGQNFLIDLNLLDLLVRSAELSPQDLVVEVGCGTGGLTARLAAITGAVLEVAIDAAFPVLGEGQLGRHNSTQVPDRRLMVYKHTI